MFDGNWKERFKPASLACGITLFAKGKVGAVEPEENGWVVDVDGERVFAPSDGCLDRASCTCGNGPLCAHVAAARLELERQFEQAAQAGLEPIAPASAKAEMPQSDTAPAAEAAPSDTAPATEAAPSADMPKMPCNDTTSVAETTLEALSDEECRAFLAQVVEVDPRWAGTLLRRYGPIERSSLEKEFARGVQKVLQANADDGFITWRNSMRCAHELSGYANDFLQPLATRGDYPDALAIVNSFALMLQTIAVDDSDGFFDQLFYTCEHWWQKAYECAPELRNALFSWMCSLIEGEGAFRKADAEVMLIATDHIENFVQNTFALEAAFAPKVEAIADGILADEANPEQDDGFKGYGTHAVPALPSGTSSRTVSMRYKRWARVRLHCMALRGESGRAIESFALGLAPTLDILQPLVDRTLSRGDSARAVALLKHAEQGGKTTESALQLARIYHHNDDTASALGECLFLVAHGSPTGDRQLHAWLQALKACAGNEWPQAQTKLQAELTNNPKRLERLSRWA